MSKAEVDKILHKYNTWLAWKGFKAQITLLVLTQFWFKFMHIHKCNEGHNNLIKRFNS